MSTATERIAVLRRARELIATGWAQGWYARSINGRRARVSSPKATSFCILGAISLASDEVSPAGYDLYIRTVTQVGGFVSDRDVAGWNDAPERTQADVLALLDSLIEDAEVAA
ncbi:MAG: hypothetical protein AB7R89_28275 [Dehalococcoidia bacterium]